jgi:hypothetical protein
LRLTLDQTHLTRIVQRLLQVGPLQIVVVRVEPADQRVEPQRRLPDIQQQGAARACALDSAEPVHGRVVFFVSGAAARESSGADFQNNILN